MLTRDDLLKILEAEMWGGERVGVCPYCGATYEVCAESTRRVVLVCPECGARDRW